MNVRNIGKSSMRLIVAALCSTALLFHPGISATAEVVLPDGAVQGLPESMVVVDENGSSVNSQSGAYFFQVEDMEPGVIYHKTIQLMNLREDVSYHIYFYMEPLDASGEINLTDECTATLTLDGEQLYQGDVGGKNTVSDTPLDLGEYEPGENRVMTCAVVWDQIDADRYIDNGIRVVGKDGEEVIQEPSGTTTITGEVTFQWVFYAVIDEEYEAPQTGLMAVKSWVWILLLAVLGVSVILLCILIFFKRRAEKKEER